MDLEGLGMCSRPSLIFAKEYKSVEGRCRCYSFELRHGNENPRCLGRREACFKYR